MNQYVVGRSNKSEILKKSAQVVMARESGDLTLLDRKLFNFLLYRSMRDLEDKKIHSIPVQEALNFLSKTSTSTLHESLARLGRVKIEIDYVDETETPHSARMHFLSYDLSHTANGMLYYAFDQILLRFLMDPRVFSAINMQIMKSFRSAYAVKLYEVMAMHEKLFNPVWTTSVENFREMFGIKDSEHKRFDNLKQRVIEKAIMEVNEIAEFDVKVEYLRGGRGGKIVAMKFETVPKNLSESLPALANIPSLSSRTRDQNTVDLLDGLTDAERGDSFILMPETRAEAIALLGEQGDVGFYEDQWREKMRGRRMRDPDASFLTWLQMQLRKDEEDSFLSDLEDDAFAALLSKAEELRDN